MDEKRVRLAELLGDPDTLVDRGIPHAACRLAEEIGRDMGWHEPAGVAFAGQFIAVFNGVASGDREVTAAAVRALVGPATQPEAPAPAASEGN